MTEENTQNQSAQERRYVIEDYSTCYLCKSTGLVEGKDDFCPNCSFPQAADDRDIGRFLLWVKRREEGLEDEKKKVRRGEYILYILGAINLIIAIIMIAGDFLTQSNFLVMASLLIVGGMFIGLGVWSRKKPFEAFIAGLATYTTLLVLSIIVEPETAFSGIIWKILIISGLFYGFKSAKEVKELEKEVLPFSYPKDFTQKK